MATSGVYDLSLSLTDIITEAFDIMQIGADGETLSADMLKRATSSLNMMIKTWEAQGIHLWSFTEGTLFLTVGQEKYDFATANLANEFFETTLAADAAASATTITVEDDADIVDGDTIGIIQEDNDIFFTTVNGVPAANVVTLTDALPLAANSGAFVRNYRGTFVPVSRILNVRRRESDLYEIPIVFESREDYFDLPNKEQLGNPIQAYYSRQEPFGVMFLWNSPISSVPVINFTYERKIQIMVDNNDTFDFPEEWFDAIVYNLAVRLIPKYGCSVGRAQYITAQAKEYLDQALAFDTAVFPITMNMEQYG